MDALFDRIRAAMPDPLVLSDDELAKLEAFLSTRPARRISYSRIQQEMRLGRSEYRDALDKERDWKAHLRFVVDYNRRSRQLENEPADQNGTNEETPDSRTKHESVPPMSVGQAEDRLRRIIEREGWPGNLRKAAAMVGCSRETIRKCPSAKPHIQVRIRVPRVQEGLDPGDCHAGGQDPVDELAFREELQAMLSTMPPDQRREVEVMTPQAQQQLVAVWSSQEKDQSEDRRPRNTHRRRSP